MSTFAQFAERLDALRQRRWRIARLERTVRAVTLAVLLALCLFAVDWYVELHWGVRLVILLVVAAVGWARMRVGRPERAPVRESLTRLALEARAPRRLTEDLIAALDFWPLRNDGTSAALKQAVVDHVDRSQARIDLAPLDRRVSWATLGGCALVAIALSLAAVRFDYSLPFLERLLLLPADYPTETRLAAVFLAERPLPVEGATVAGARVPRAEASVMRVGTIGEVPAQIDVEIVDRRGDAAGTIPLHAAGISAPQGAPPVHWYSGRIPPSLYPFRMRLAAGDLATRWFDVEVVDRPQPQLRLRVADSQTPRPQSWQPVTGPVEVDAGARVEVSVRAAGTPLREVMVRWQRPEHQDPTPLAAQDRMASEWLLPVGETPLAEVAGPIDAQIHVLGRHGFGPRRPLELQIRLRTPEPPAAPAPPERPEEGRLAGPPDAPDPEPGERQADSPQRLLQEQQELARQTAEAAGDPPDTAAVAQMALAGRIAGLPADPSDALWRDEAHQQARRAAASLFVGERQAALAHQQAAQRALDRLAERQRAAGKAPLPASAAARHRADELANLRRDLDRWIDQQHELARGNSGESAESRAARQRAMAAEIDRAAAATHAASVSNHLADAAEAARGAAEAQQGQEPAARAQAQTLDSLQAARRAVQAEALEQWHHGWALALGEMGRAAEALFRMAATERRIAGGPLPPQAEAQRRYVQQSRAHLAQSLRGMDRELAESLETAGRVSSPGGREAEPGHADPPPASQEDAGQPLAAQDAAQAYETVARELTDRQVEAAERLAQLAQQRLQVVEQTAVEIAALRDDQKGAAPGSQPRDADFRDQAAGLADRLSLADAEAAQLLAEWAGSGEAGGSDGPAGEAIETSLETIARHLQQRREELEGQQRQLAEVIGQLQAQRAAYERLVQQGRSDEAPTASDADAGQEATAGDRQALREAVGQFAQAETRVGEIAAQLARQTALGDPQLRSALDAASKLRPLDDLTTAQHGRSSELPHQMGDRLIPDSARTTALAIAGWEDRSGSARGGDGLAGQGSGAPDDSAQSSGGSSGGGAGGFAASGAAAGADSAPSEAGGPASSPAGSATSQTGGTGEAPGSPAGSGSGGEPGGGGGGGGLAGRPADDTDREPGSLGAGLVGEEDPWLAMMPPALREALEAQARPPAPPSYARGLEAYFSSPGGDPE